MRARDPNSLAAYALWLRGLDDMLSFDRQRCQDALGHFFRAVSVDQTYARALSGISRAHGFRWMYRWAEQREAALAEAEELALQAVDADANDPGASRRARLGGALPARPRPVARGLPACAGAEPERRRRARPSMPTR